MFNIRNLCAGVLFLMLAVPVFSAPAQQIKRTTAPVRQTQPAMQSQTNVQAPMKVLPLDLVQEPAKFLNKKVTMSAKFDKFSTLGLDYKKAFRDSTKYIGFLIQRDDVIDHNIPLSELKLFVKREYAEKFVDLNTGDKISISGTVFSTALGDPWVDISAIQVLEKNPNAKQK